MIACKWGIHYKVKKRFIYQLQKQLNFYKKLDILHLKGDFTNIQARELFLFTDMVN